jgi:hypothetical protein
MQEQMRLSLIESSKVFSFERYHVALLYQWPRCLCIADTGQVLQFLKTSRLHSALSLATTIRAFH